MIDDYRRYFSDEYRNLTKAISDYSQELLSEHSNEVQLEFERTVGRVSDSWRFWSEFRGIGTFDIEATTIVDAWKKAREKVSERLAAKAAAPLETLPLGEDAADAIAQYTSLRRGCDAANLTIKQANRVIADVKRETEVMDRGAIQAQIDELERVQVRHSSTVADACDAYNAEEDALASTRAEGDTAKELLKAYRKAAFPGAQEGINRRLGRFAVGFEIEGFESHDLRSGPTSGYAIKLNGQPVPVRSENTPVGEHSFGNTLSAGDRSALALAFFLEAIERHERISDLIVVLDDPVSSLDKHRRSVTVEDVRTLVDNTKQVIVLSHSAPLLCAVWKKVKPADRNSASTLEIVRSGSGSSLALWDIEEALREEHTKRHRRFTNFVESGKGDREAVASDLRDHLEGFLQVAFPAECRPEETLGWFVHQCQLAVNDGRAILDQDRINELRDLNDYASRFKHDGGERRSMGTINDAELVAYTKRVLAFTRPQ